MMSKELLRSALRAAGIRATWISPYTDDGAALAAMLRRARVDLLLDVGANVGQYAMERIEMGYRGRIISFEPLSACRAVLLRNAARYPNWQVADQCAVGDRKCVIEMRIAKDSRASSVLSATNAHLEQSEEAQTVATETVTMDRLDQVAQPFLEQSQKPFLKIDVQGFEDQVLQGSTNILPKLLGLQLELSFAPIYEGQKLFPEMISTVTGMGFTLYRMIPAWIEHETGRWLQADGIFFRD